MDKATMDFTRGAIFAADDFAKLPQTILSGLQTELQIRQSKTAKPLEE